MNNKKLVQIIIAMVLILVILKLSFKLLPYALIGGGAYYLYTKHKHKLLDKEKYNKIASNMKSKSENMHGSNSKYLDKK